MEILNEYKHMVDNNVFEVVYINFLPSGTKIIDRTRCTAHTLRHVCQTKSISNANLENK